MKNFTIFFLAFLGNFGSIFGQNDCGFPSIGTTGTFNTSGIDFFSESVCEPLILKCNIVILMRNNGTGGLSPSSNLWSDWENAMNANLANVQDPENCSTGYPLDSKIRVKLTTHTIPNTLAWDWYAETNRDNYTGHPNSYIC
ncbi:MAG: hypothetical protein JPMHGGIA_02347 [Saprospiraceae bacterium]|jgi:hypothetical protein|nr:hypothetical protein [Saprospiraceae bacterium]